MSTALLIQFLLCPIVFISLIYVTAPYGRHHKQGWGPNLPNRLAWFLMELPALLVISILVIKSGGLGQMVVWLPLLFWVFHYGYRTFFFPLWMRPSNNTFPVLLVVFAIAFNGLNGYNNAQALITDPQPIFSIRFITGALIFIGGFVLHSHSDYLIRQLRRPGEQGYRIPQGGGFRWVSSPHYLGEIIQWCGWAVMTWSLAGLAFALFTFCNLAPRAISNHRWYLSTFEDYPRHRKILIPGVY